MRGCRAMLKTSNEGSHQKPSGCCNREQLNHVHINGLIWGIGHLGTFPEAADAASASYYEQELRAGHPKRCQNANLHGNIGDCTAVPQMTGISPE